MRLRHQRWIICTIIVGIVTRKSILIRAVLIVGFGGIECVVVKAVLAFNILVRKKKLFSLDTKTVDAGAVVLRVIVRRASIMRVVLSLKLLDECHRIDGRWQVRCSHTGS